MAAVLDQPEVYAADIDPAAVACARRNLDPVGGQVFEGDLYEPLLECSELLLAEDGLVVAEHFHKRALPETIGRLACTRSVRIGDHKLTFYARHAGAGDPSVGPGGDGRGGPE